MRNPFLKTYLALAVLLALGGYVYWKDKHKTDKPGDEKPKVLAFDKAKVREIRLEPSFGDAVALVKKAEGWRLQGTPELAAGSAEVDGLIASLEALEAGDAVSEQAKDLKQYGLDPPLSSASVVLEGAPQPLQVQLGMKTFDNASVYAKRPAEPKVFLIPANLAAALEKKPFDLRDRDLLHVQRDKLKTLEVTGPEGGFTLERTGKDDWAATKPLKTRAGRWPIDGLLGTLENLRMDAVGSEAASNLKPFGLDKPARSVTLVLEDGSRRRLEIGSATPDKKYYAKEALSQLVALIPPALVEDLSKGLSNLRAKRLLDISTYDVVGLEGKLEGTARAWSRTSEKGKDGFDVHKWKRTAPDAKDVETAKVEDALFKLSGLEAQEFVDAPGSPDKYGLDTPLVELKLSQGKEQPVLTVALGKKDGAVYARRDGDDALLKLDPAKVDELLAALKAL